MIWIYIFAYMFMCLVTSVIRGLAIDEPEEDMWAHEDWKIGNFLVPLFWPLTIWMMTGAAARKYKEAVHNELSE